jgi:hypothetical protein
LRPVACFGLALALLLFRGWRYHDGAAIIDGLQHHTPRPSIVFSMFPSLAGLRIFDRTNRDAKDESAEVMVVLVPEEEDGLDEVTAPVNGTCVPCKMLPPLDYDGLSDAPSDRFAVEVETRDPVWRLSTCDPSSS